MLRPRIIPCLLLSHNGLVKTIQFKKRIYVGDPINAINIFNTKEVDELLILDIDATTQATGPNMALIQDIASECFMPLSYGGGVSTIEQMETLYAAGVEKISLSSALFTQPQLLQQASRRFGASSVIATLDVKTNWRRQSLVYTHNGKKATGLSIQETAKRMEAEGAGELCINMILRDGMMQGYDLELIAAITAQLRIPVIACGGAGSLMQCRDVIRAGASAAAAGSLFVFHGKHKAVLIQYPSSEEIDSLFDIPSYEQ